MNQECKKILDSQGLLFKRLYSLSWQIIRQSLHHLGMIKMLSSPSRRCDQMMLSLARSLLIAKVPSLVTTAPNPGILPSFPGPVLTNCFQSHQLSTVQMGKDKEDNEELSTATLRMLDGVVPLLNLRLDQDEHSLI